MDNRKMLTPATVPAPDLSGLPRIFRLTRVNLTVEANSRLVYDAHLFHERASLRVTWTTNHPDIRLKPNLLVSPRWNARPVSQDGTLRIARLALLERPEPQENLFDLVPPGWVKDRTLVAHAHALLEILPRPLQHLFNAIFWDGQRFRRFCLGPSSLRGHHAETNGNLRHTVDTAEQMRDLCSTRTYAHLGVGVLAALLHDAGKADEYRLAPDGGWSLTDRGRLLGHKITVTEWIAAAQAKWNIPVPFVHYQALLHALTAISHAPDWMGARAPATMEARLLSIVDRLSGTVDLMDRCTAPDGGWGTYHPHLKGRPFMVAGEVE
jgi:3'-5' exoribonuclease